MLIPRFVPLLPSCVYVYLCVDLLRQQLKLPYPIHVLEITPFRFILDFNKSYFKLVQSMDS